MTLEALIFGGIGTLAEVAELDRAAWNAAFRVHGIGVGLVVGHLYRVDAPGRGSATGRALYAAHLGQVVDAEALDQSHQRHFRHHAGRRCATAPRRGAGSELGGTGRRQAGPRQPVRTGAGTRAAQGDGARNAAAPPSTWRSWREDVSRMAPNPEAMVAAVTELGIGPGRAVAIVDTPVALEAARTAGLPALAFPGRLAEAPPPPPEPEDFGQVAMAHVPQPRGPDRRMARRGAAKRPNDGHDAPPRLIWLKVDRGRAALVSPSTDRSEEGDTHVTHTP